MSNIRTRARGVGARLLIVIFGIGAVSALVAGAAIYAFVEVGHSLAPIDRRVDPILASLEVTRSVERIVTAASALSAATTEQRREHLFAKLSHQSAKLRSFLTELRDGGIDREQLAPIDGNAALLDANLTALDADVRLRLHLIGRIKDLMKVVFDTNEETQRLLGPTLLVYDSQLDHLAKLLDAVGQPSEPRGEDVRPLIAGLLAARPVQKVQQQASDAADTLAQASVSDQKQRLLILAFQLRRTVGELEKGSQALDPKLRPLFLAQLDKLKTFVEGPDSIPQLRQHELDLVADAGRLLAENDTLSTELTTAAEQLVEATKREVRGATAAALRIQRLSTETISALLALGFAGSVLIVWLYVGRNIVRRLNLLSGAMFAIAGGGRETVVPTSGSDEIAAMGRSRCSARTRSNATRSWPSAPRRPIVWSTRSRSAPPNSASSRRCCLSLSTIWPTVSPGSTRSCGLPRGTVIFRRCSICLTPSSAVGRALRSTSAISPIAANIARPILRRR